MPARNTTKRIAVITGSRADFGLLLPVINAIQCQDFRKTLDLQLVVTGVHLTTGSVRDVGQQADIAAKVPMQRKNQHGRHADVEALGRGITSFGKTFATLQPHIVLVLGDRIEALAAATAASVGGLHLAHIHGGDRAEGVADESIRHAISKLAHLHFPATTTSRRRLIRLGENPDYIYQHGSPAIDNLDTIQPDPHAPDLIIIQHPVGLPDQAEQKHMAATLKATRKYSRLVMAPNSDPGCCGIRAAIAAAEITPVQHLPRPRFLAILAGAKAIVGNSSAGLIEAAALKTPCVNIGPRQAGREQPKNVKNATYGLKNVQNALNLALKFNLKNLKHPYGDGNTGQKIARTLANVNLEKIPIRKQNTY